MMSLLQNLFLITCGGSVVRLLFQTTQQDTHYCPTCLQAPPPPKHNLTPYTHIVLSPDEESLVPIDHVQQQPLVCVRQLVAVGVLVLQVKARLVQAQAQARHLTGGAGGGGGKYVMACWKKHAIKQAGRCMPA